MLGKLAGGKRTVRISDLLEWGKDAHGALFTQLIICVISEV